MASYGLGENIVQGAVNPDEFMVFKPTLKQGFRPILSKIVGTKETKLIYDIGGSKSTKNIPVPPSERKKLVLSDQEILELARWACVIEDHYSAVNGKYTPMDMEWAKDGITGQLFIVQARPETVQSRKKKLVLRTYRLKSTGKRLVSGHSVGEAIGTGKARLILDAHRMGEFQSGEILVTDKTDPDWEPVMKKAAAIVTNQGGRTCHAAIIARELGIPAIVGSENATGVLKTGQEITVSCAEGEIGYVYDGVLPFEVSELPLDQLPKTRHANSDEHRQSGRCVQPLGHSQRWRWAGAAGIHHRQSHPGAPDGFGPFRGIDRSAGEGAIGRPHRVLQGQASILCGQAGARRRP